MQNIETSLSGSFWRQHTYNDRFVESIMQKLNCSDLLAKLLSTRIDNIDEIDVFYNPRVKSYLGSALKMKDIQKGADRVFLALLKQETIGLFADYDVDGSTSCSILIKLFQILSANYSVYIPDRVKEGYGLTKTAVSILNSKGINLLITMDCGASSQDEISYAKSLGIDVIVLDHHISDFIVKDVVALVNPNRIDEDCKFGYLAAVGVTYLFAVAVFNAIKKDVNLFAKISNFNLLSLLDLVALGTVCDVVPLVGLNRAFVSQGLKVLSKRINIGLRSLSDVSSIKSYLTTYHLGFILGPRINAASRMGDAQLPVKILCTNSDSEATEYALRLDDYNKSRQSIESEILEQAVSYAKYNLSDSPILIIDKENWHLGVIGIVASRIKDLFNKPVIILSWQADGVGKASCRSIKGVNLGAKLIAAKAKKLLINGGGHSMAGGFSINRDKFIEFKKYISESVLTDIKRNSSVKNYCYYSDYISCSALNEVLLEDISNLSPFGVANEEPIFRIDNIKVCNVIVRGGRHISCIIYSVNSYKRNAVKAILYGGYNTALGEFLLSNPKNRFSILSKLQANYWNGKQEVQCIIIDIICKN